MRKLIPTLTTLTVLLATAHTPAQSTRPADDPFTTGQFHWRSTPPLIAPEDRDGDHFYSIKDPSVVRHNDAWHVFATVRGRHRSHQIEYLTFPDWDHAGQAERHVLPITPDYFCAPQVFYFTPQKQWYLIYQIKGRQPDLLPAFSTNSTVADWQHWTKPTPLFDTPPANLQHWIDFWVICDDRNAHLFATSNDGHMWRSDTPLEHFPRGWSEPKIVLTADVFEASHTYKLKGRHQYLTMIEAVAPGWRRYYKAYVADSLTGDWHPLAATLDHPFAAKEDVSPPDPHWADSISHGELLRTGVDEKMEVDPLALKFLYQGVLQSQIHGKPYGEIPWRLGLLELTPAP